MNTIQSFIIKYILITILLLIPASFYCRAQDSVSVGEVDTFVLESFYCFAFFEDDTVFYSPVFEIEQKGSETAGELESQWVSYIKTNPAISHYLPIMQGPYTNPKCAFDDRAKWLDQWPDTMVTIEVDFIPAVSDKAGKLKKSDKSKYDKIK